jgi:hypothetical protein
MRLFFAFCLIRGNRHLTVGPDTFGLYKSSEIRFPISSFLLMAFQLSKYQFVVLVICTSLILPVPASEP